MAMNEFEFLGIDRYFKYRYVQEYPMNVTTILETWEMIDIATRYRVLTEYVERALNIKLIFEGHKVSYFDIGRIYNEPNFLNNVHTAMFPVTRSFFDGRQEYFSPSPILDTFKTIIVSAAPKKVVFTSLSFLNMDTPVLILTGLTLVLLSHLLVIHSIATNKYKSLPTKKVVKKLAQETMENIWENASLLCAEPIPSVLPHITCRLLAASWVIGVTFILFFLGCYLRTEFTTESYSRIDTLSDLIKSGIPPTIIEGSGALKDLQILAEEDPVVKEWLDALDQENIFSSPVEYIECEGYIPILSGEKVLITEDYFLVLFLGQLLADDPENKEFFVKNGGLYFSQHHVAVDYVQGFFNTSWMRSTPQLHENLQLSMEPMFETKVMKYVDFEKHYIIETVKWERPMKSTADLDLSSVFVPFCFLFTMLSGTVVVLIIEIFFKRFA